MSEYPSWHPNSPGYTGALPNHSRPPDGTFPKGVSGNKVGRPKGAKDKLPANLKRSFVDALNSFGSDGNGTDGIEGFVHYAIRNDLRGVLAVVAKIIPMRIEGDASSHQINSVVINTIPANHFIAGDHQIIEGEVIDMRRAGNG